MKKKPTKPRRWFVVTCDEWCDIDTIHPTEKEARRDETGWCADCKMVEVVQLTPAVRAALKKEGLL